MSEVITAEGVTVAEIVGKAGPLPAIAESAAERPAATVDNARGQVTLLQLIERAINNPVLDLARVAS